MTKGAVPVRTVGVSSTRQMVRTVLTIAVPLLGLYAVLQAASLMNTGDWVPAGPNPLTVLVQFAFRDRAWTPSHTLAAAVLVGAVAVSALLYSVASRPQRRAKTRVDGTARYLGKAEAFTEGAVRKHAETALGSSGDVVGLPLAKVVSTGKQFWVGFRDGVIALMGPGSGKTAAMVITGALDAPGPVWVTSNKPDIVAALYTSRAHLGRTYVFDPQQIAHQPAAFFYDPLSYIRGGLVTRGGRDLDQRDPRAIELAQQFAKSGRAADAKTDAFFDPAGQTLLANLMLAAALEHLPLTTVLEWTYSAEKKTARDILRKHGKVTASKQVEGVQGLFHETRNSVFQTASNFLTFLQNDAGRAWIERSGPDDTRDEFDPDAFVRSAGDMMICLSREGVGSFGPVLAAMTNATLRAAEDYAAQCPGGRLERPFVLQLDEVANVCRVTSLPDLVSHVGSRGIFIAPYLQSPAQGRAGWGDDGWEKLFGASVVRILGRGLIDVKFLKEMSDAIGEQDVVRHVTNSSHGGRGGGQRTHNAQWTKESIMPVSELVALPQWRAVAVASGERAALLELVPHFRREDLKERVAQSKRDFLADHPDLTGEVLSAELEDEGTERTPSELLLLGEDVA